MSRIPSPTRRVISLLVAAPFIIAACSAGDSDGGATDDAASAAPEASASAAPTLSSEPVADSSDDGASGAAAWLDIQLTDAESGEPFTLASLQGQVVAIEPMAVWCSNCRDQQDRVKEVFSEIDAAGVRYISLGIDPGEDPDALARYAERHGYAWTFAQSPRELSRALSDLFGPQILSAPSTPLIVLDAGGEVVRQEFGPHSPDKLLGFLEEAAA